MPQYPSIIDLSTLNGTNGFRLDGIDPSDFAGHSVASAGDVNGDGVDDLIIGAFGADPGGDTDAGEAYVVFGAANGWSAAFDLATLNGANGFRLDGIDPGDRLGRVASAGDVNGDGFDDLIIGAPGGGAGETYVVFGAASGWSAALDLATLNGVNGFRLDGIDPGDQSGVSVASAGDFNGDGFDDLIIGAPDADPNGDSSAGETYVVFGAAGGWGAAFDLATLDGNSGFRLDGVDPVDTSGISVAGAGDVNGDGFDDLIIGAYQADPGGDARAGETYVVFGAAGGWSAALDLATLNGTNGFRLDGIDPDDVSGYSVASAGDVNADGFADLIISAYAADPNGDSDAGETYVVFGAAGGWGAALDLATLNGTNGFRLDGIDAGDLSGGGVAVASAGDVNGDGFDDLIIGALNADPGGDSNAGETYVVFGAGGGWSATFDLSTLNGNNGLRLDGVDADDLSGRSVAGAGDVNGDGFDDIIIGAYQGDPGGDANAGESYVIFGGAPGEAVTRTGTAIDNTIHGSAFGDVINGLGGNDRLIGGLGDDALNGGAGRDTATVSGNSGDATWVRDISGAWTVTSADGVDTLTDVEFVAFADRTVFLNRAAHTFSGDGGSDILLYRASDGVTGIWSMDGATLTGAALTNWQAGTDWSVEGVGDFNGDGRDDFLLRRVSDGVTAIWNMDGANVDSGDVTQWQADLGWSISHTGDFNGDGRDDILWRRDSDGVLGIWSMDGFATSSGGVTSQQAGVDWDVHGVGDFDGDGQDDLLLRNTDGVTGIWRMFGTNVIEANLTSQQAGNDWDFAGVGDFNGDGKDDFLLRHDSGVTAIWTMQNGLTVASADVTSEIAGADWSVAQVGDYNGDGSDDILFVQDGTGATMVWVMDGATVVSSDLTTQQAGTEWGYI